MDIKPLSLAPAKTALPAAAAPPQASSAAAPAAPVAKPVGPVDPETLTLAIKNINSALKDKTPGLEFSIDDDSQRTVVRIVDRDTQQVIRQLPSEEALEIAKAIDTLTGLLQKQSA